MPTLKDLIAGDDLVVAPVALNPIMARLAEQAGFKAIYLSGGSLGWVKCVTEANLTLPELADVAVDMRAVCRLPIILDAGGGWGDPAHMHRTIALTEAAGFAAIELEDQLLPRHFEHHVGRENLVTLDLVVKKEYGRLVSIHKGFYDTVPLSSVTSEKKVVDVSKYYNTDRLRPIYQFDGAPLFIMTSD